jgi:hypothetical protein
MIRLRCICFLVVAGLVSTAAADSVTLNFHDTSWGGGLINVNYGGSNSHSGVSGSEETGFYKFLVKEPGQSGLADESYVGLFCFELEQYTDSWSQPKYDVVYTIGDLEDGPNGSGTPIDPMGDDRANLVRRLYKENYSKLTDNVDDDALEKKAFQMAIWEIVHELDANLLLDGGDGDEGKGSNYNLTTGNFKVTDNSSAVTKAQQWLDAITVHDGGELALVKAFLSDTNQDQLYYDGSSVVPSPTAVVNLAGLGLMIGWVAYRRRRRG